MKCSWCQKAVPEKTSLFSNPIWKRGEKRFCSRLCCNLDRLKEMNQPEIDQLTLQLETPPCSTN